jgi:hypothetical protein
MTSEHRDEWVIPDPVLDAGWKPLYRAAAASALVVLALVAAQMVVFVAWPLPVTVTEWFALFRRNRFVGLIDLDLLMMVDNVAIALVFLALYAALRRTNQSLMAIALVVELMAVTTYFSSNTAFEMLSLSDRHVAATTETQRLAVEAAGQAMIATWQGSAFNVSYVLGAVAILITATVMRRSRIFTRTTANIGLLFGLLSLVPASAGRLGLVLSLASLVPMCIWLILIARRLFRLGSP